MAMPRLMIHALLDMARQVRTGGACRWRLAIADTIFMLLALAHAFRRCCLHAARKIRISLFGDSAIG